jgi:hypothetical protein
MCRLLVGRVCLEATFFSLAAHAGLSQVCEQFGNFVNKLRVRTLRDRPVFDTPLVLKSPHESVDDQVGEVPGPHERRLRGKKLFTIMP